MSSDNKMRILIADDDALVRDGLAMVLEQSGKFTITNSVENGRQALDALENKLPDVVLLDISMPDMDGLECCRRVKERYPNLPVLLLTTFQNDEYLATSLDVGAHGYLLKHQSTDAVILAIQNAINGNMSFDPGVAQSLRVRSDSPDAARLAGLSSRERGVLELVVEGCSNRQIAAKLFLSEGTVRNYVSALLQFADVRDRTQLVVWYYRGASDSPDTENPRGERR